MKYVGELRPSSSSPSLNQGLVKLAGFGKNIEGSRKEARRLLKEAGVPEGFSFTLKNRNVREPSEVTGVYVIDQWRQVGLNVNHVQQEEGAYFNQSSPRVITTPGSISPVILWTTRICSCSSSSAAIKVPSITLDTTTASWMSYTTGGSRATDPKERLKLIRQFEKRVIDRDSYQSPTLWWRRRAALNKVKGWKITPSLRRSRTFRMC